MARSWIHRVLRGDGPSPEAQKQAEQAMRLDVMHELMKAEQAGKGSTHERPKSSSDDTAFKGADWDRTRESSYFSGDLPVMGHPGAKGLSFPTLRAAAERSICAPFKMKRQQQFLEYCIPQRDQWSQGYALGMRDPTEKVSKGAEKDFRKIQAMLNRYQPFHRTMGMMADDSLTFDWTLAEIQYERGGRPYAFKALDAETIRRGRPKPQDGEDGYNWRSDTFVQVLSSIDRIVATWHEDEIMCVVRRPRTTIGVFGYGYPEIQQAYDAIAAFIEADDYNQAYFRNGAHASTLLMVMAKFSPEMWQAFKMMMTAQIKGVNNAHRLAMALLDPGTSEGTRERIEKLDLAHTNNDIQFADLMLIKLMIVAANFNMRPSEAGLPEYKGAGQPLSGANPKDEIQLSRMYGLRPILTSFEDAINYSLVYRWDPDFSFRFIADTETETSRLETVNKAIQSGVYSRNEGRMALGKAPVDAAFFKANKIPVTDDKQRDAIITACAIPLDPQVLQAISALQPMPDEGGGMEGPPGAEGAEGQKGAEGDEGGPPPGADGDAAGFGLEDNA